MEPVRQPVLLQLPAAAPTLSHEEIRGEDACAAVGLAPGTPPSADAADPPIVASEGRDYSSYLFRMAQSMGPKIAQQIPAIPASGTIYDIGSGSGDQSHAYARLFPHTRIVGIDAAPESIAHASDRFQAPNLEFRLANVLTGFAPAASARGVIASSVEHEIFSFTGYSRDNLGAFLRQVERVLISGESFTSRDFSSPFWPEKVRVRLPAAAENGDGPHGKFSRAELFEIYARDVRTGDFPNGVKYTEIPTGDPEWREFELDGVAAANFILRMEYRDNWEAELKEQYLYWDLAQRIAALELAGLRVDYAAEVHNTWIYLNWWKDRLVVTDTEELPIDLPPTNMIAFATKPGPDDPRALDILAAAVRPGTEAFPLRSYLNPDSGKTWDTVHVDGETWQFIPYERDTDGLVYVHAHRRTEKPALRYYADQSQMYHVRYSGYVTQSLGGIIRNGDATSAEDEFAKIWEDVSGSGNGVLERGSGFLPSPGLSDERVTTHYIDLGITETITENSKLQRIELKQLIAAGNVGSIPDGRLEVAAYSLARKTGTVLLPWFDGKLPIDDQQIHDLTVVADYPRPPFSTAFELTEAHAGFGATLTLDLRRTQVDGSAVDFSREYLVPLQQSLDTFSVTPYFSADGKIYIGLETRDLPTFQAHDLPTQVAVIPAWRMPRDAASRGEATRILKDFMQRDFDLITRHVTPLGEGYFPSMDTTPEKVTPFAVEVDAARPPRDLTFVPLDELLDQIENIPDLHTRLAIFRLAHAMGIFNRPK